MKRIFMLLIATILFISLTTTGTVLGKGKLVDDPIVQNVDDPIVIYVDDPIVQNVDDPIVIYVDDPIVRPSVR